MTVSTSNSATTWSSMRRYSTLPAAVDRIGRAMSHVRIGAIAAGSADSTIRCPPVSPIR